MTGIVSPRVDLQTLAGCCVRTVQRRAELPAEGDTAACDTCGRPMEVTDGRWHGRPSPT